MRYLALMIGIAAIVSSVVAYGAGPDDIQTRFEEWAAATGDDDGDGVPNGLDKCPDTKGHLVELYRAHGDEASEEKRILSDLIIPQYYAPMRFIGYVRNTAKLLFPEGIEGMNRTGKECRSGPFVLAVPKGEHKRIECTDLSIVIFDAEYANIHPLVMIPPEWIGDGAPGHEAYREDGPIYIYTGRGSPTNAYEMGIPVGCAIEFPLEEWKERPE
jgi:hypothetical protein